MSTFKSIINGMALALLPLFLLSFGTLASIYQVLGSPQSLKDAIHQSGVYEVAVSEALRSAQDRAKSEGGQGNIPLDNPQVQQAIENAVSPEFVQGQAEQAIDDAFGWAQGDTKELKFNFNLVDAQSKLADNLAGYAEQRLAELPTCQNGETAAIDDPLKATCVPAGFDRAAAVAKVRNNIAGDPNLLRDTSISANDLKDAQGRPLNDKFGKIPAIYEQVRWGMYASGALAILCAIGAIFCAGTIRNGLKRVAIISLVIGIISTLLAWGSGFILHFLTTRMAEGGGSDIQSHIVKAVELFTGDLRQWWLIYGLVLAGLGIVTLVVLRLTQPPKDKITELPPKPIIPVSDASRMRDQGNGSSIVGKQADTTVPPSAPAVPKGYRKGPKVQ